MPDYRIIVTHDAVKDLTGLRDYIVNVLLAPETALSCIQTIHTEIAALADMPSRHKLVDEEPWHTLSIRRMVVKNFCVYYRIDAPARTVHILNVIYVRRDQLKQLTRIKLD